MRKILFAATALGALALAPVAHAALITGFTQASGGNTVTATEINPGIQTQITISDALVNLGGGLLGSIPGATLNMTATSRDAAVASGTPATVTQHYDGTFCISSGAGCTGNFLQGIFADAAFGALGGPGLTININNPPESLILTSNLLSPSVLLAPNSFSLAFSGLEGVPTDNGLVIDGATIGAFTASFSGTVSASSVKAPEPASLALLGVGLLGLGFVANRKRSV